MRCINLNPYVAQNITQFKKIEIFVALYFFLSINSNAFLLPTFWTLHVGDHSGSLSALWVKVLNHRFKLSTVYVYHPLSQTIE